MKFLRKLVLHNAGLKLLALLLSFLLWSAYVSEPRVEIGYDVPVEFARLGDTIEVGADTPTTVHVRLRGRSAVLRRLTPADIAVRVDLAGRGTGEMLYRPAADTLGLPPGVEVVRIVPQELRIRLLPRQP